MLMKKPWYIDIQDEFYFSLMYSLYKNIYCIFILKILLVQAFFLNLSNFVYTK